MLTHNSPHTHRFAAQLDTASACNPFIQVLSPDGRSPHVRYDREPLHPRQALPFKEQRGPLPRSALPDPLRYYGLMRQTSFLRAPRFFRLRSRSVQVAARPCCNEALPDLISAILAWVPGPIPRGDLPVLSLVASRQTAASPHGRRVRLTRLPLLSNFYREGDFEAAVIPLCSGSQTR